MLQTQNLLTINKNTMNMKTLDMKAWAESARNGRRRLAIPIMTHPGIELCGYTVRDAVTDGEVHARAILALNDRYPADACSVIMDLTVEAEAFGAHIVFPENEVPSVTDTLVHDLSEIEALKIPTLEAGRIPQYLKANRIVAEALGDKPLFAGCIGPFSLAGRLFGMTELMMATFTEPETIQLLLEKCTRFIGDYCIALKKSGAQGVVIAEPAAGLVSNEDCSLYSSLYVRRIVELVQDDRFLVVLHNCGNTGHCTEAMVETGSAGYHFGNQAGMVAALEACPADTLVMGNIDPVGLFKQASADEMYRATQELLNATAAYPNFILSSGCDVPPETPHANIDAFYKALSEYNKTTNRYR
jgi:uroporphyrinogen decarboxylase